MISSASSRLRPDDVRAAGLQTFGEVLDYRAATSPEVVAFRMLGSDGVERGSLTFAALRDRARAIAERLSLVAAPGDRVAVLVAPGLDYVAAFFGCLYAQMVAVPAYPPNPRRDDQRVAGMLQDSGARVAIITAALRDRLAPLLATSRELASAIWVTADAEEDGPRSSWSGSVAAAHDLAMLQYTSGSTTEPRGVRLTHANLFSNARVIHRVTAHRWNEVAVFWLPPFHDMGLMGAILHPVYIGITSILMSPATFLQRPFVWLEAMSRYRGTTTGAPNFAYDLCVQRVTPAERATLDLGSWRVAFNGAEPVRAETQRRFIDAFAPCGLRPSVMVPCYGLAEATLLVSGGAVTASRVEIEPSVVAGASATAAAGESGDEAAAATEAQAATEPEAAVHAEIPTNAKLGCGAPDGAHTLVIATPPPCDGALASRCANGSVGEIWVRGPSVAAGYWNRPAENVRTFGGALADDPEPYLRTGDLGFLRDGQLHVIGRISDVINLQGRNVFPQDIERAAESAHAALRPGYCVAFGVPGAGQERVVIVAEVARTAASTLQHGIRAAVCAATVAATGVLPDEVCFVRAHALPRTSSGKVQRRATRAAWLDGQVAEVWQRDAVVPATSANAHAPVASLRSELLALIASELSVQPSAIDASLAWSELGLESLSVLRLQLMLEERLGHAIDPRMLWEAASVDGLVARLATSASSRGNAEERVPSFVLEGDTPRDTCDVTTWPEYRALQSRRQLLAAAEIVEPFFGLQDAVAGATTLIGGRRMTNFASYDYLGLSGHPLVVQAAQDAIARWGTSVSASRLVSGERAIHQTLETSLAEFLGVDAALTFVGGHATNVSTITHLVTAGDLVCCDERLHNSGMQGAQFSGAYRLVFAHNDWHSLDEQLARLRHRYRRVLILIESVYSADGDVPDLEAFVRVKRAHQAMLMVDEAHGLGVLGNTGRGIAECAGVGARDVDVWMGTFSKALASCGGYIAGPAALIEYLRYTCPGFVFSVGMPPASAAAALAALEVLKREPQRVERLRGLAARFRARAGEAGLAISDDAPTPVVPLIVGDTARAIQLSWSLLAQNIHVQPMIAPAVPEDGARLRFFLSSEHTTAQVDDAVAALESALSPLAQRP